MRQFAAWQMIRRQSFRWVGLASAVVMVIASLTLLALWQARDIRILSVASGSMAPLLSEGDAAVVWRAEPGTIRVGDMVSYPSPDASMVVTHRVIQADPGTRTLITKGDANPVADPPVRSTDVYGRVRYVIPGAGHVLDALRSGPGLALTVYVPALLVLAHEMRRLVRHYYRPTYQLRYRRQ